MRLLDKRILLGVLVSVLMLSGCSSKNDSTSEKSVDAKKKEVTTTTTIESDPVGKLIITDVPKEFKVMDDDYGDTGPSDLAKAVRDDSPDSDETVKDSMVADGFVHGYQRLWQVDSDDRQIIVFLYEFKKEDGANSFVKRHDQVSKKFFSEDGRAFDTSIFEEIPNSTTLIVSSALEGYKGISISFTKDKYAVQIVVNQHEEVQDRSFVELCKKLALDQYNLL